MKYQSTRDKNVSINAAGAIVKGLSLDRGLFVPTTLPHLNGVAIEGLAAKTYNERAKEILSLFLTDFTKEQIEHCVDSAYTDKKFESEEITQISHLYDGTYMLELWGGPTCAFKDMALQILPHLLTTSQAITNTKGEIVILVATSGDTGKAALEGFKDVKGVKVIVFYPENGVSPMQKRQMQTQQGGNVYVCGIKGNFDDAQTGVKRIFADDEFSSVLGSHNIKLSSANSINWGRLLPQIVYYFSCYADLIKNEEIKCGEVVNVTVPTGNFGNILAAYYAKRMGLPLGKLICASNKNNILTDFIDTGIYDRNREFYQTLSPSMDILISSNLERLLFDLTDRDDTVVQEYYNKLSNTGRFEVGDEVKAKLKENFFAGCCDDEGTSDTIKKVFSRYSYLCDTHTAVAVNVYEQYKQKTGDDKKVIIVSTASPYKFVSSVLESIDKNATTGDEYKDIDKLYEISGLEVSSSLAELEELPILHSDVIESESMLDYIKGILL